VRLATVVPTASPNGILQGVHAQTGSAHRC
jgi:hypothetical protein